MNIFKSVFNIDYGENFYFKITIFGIKIKSRGLFNFIYGNPLKTNCSIYNLDELQKKGTRFFHPTGICIAEKAVIGKNCIINQNVTIGQGKGGFPMIGDNVQILSGAVVIGAIKVGNNAVIGANSVVTKDVPENAVVAGVPAKFLRFITEEEIKIIIENKKK